MLKDKQDLIDEKCLDKHGLNTSFRNLFILDCCRSENEESQFLSFFNKLTSFNKPSFPLEIKNTAFLYATPLGCPSYTLNDGLPYSVLSYALYERLLSDFKNGSSRNLCSIAKAIQCHLVDDYQKRNNEKEDKDDGKNIFSSIAKTVPTSVPKNNQVQMSDPKFNIFLKSNINILFGDITMGNFTFFDPPKPETTTTTIVQNDNITSQK